MAENLVKIMVENRIICSMGIRILAMVTASAHKFLPIIQVFTAVLVRLLEPTHVFGYPQNSYNLAENLKFYLYRQFLQIFIDISYRKLDV